MHPRLTPSRRGAAALAISVLAALTPVAQAASSRDPGLTIVVLSNRADLVSGGDALVEVVLPARVSPGSLHVSDGGRDITSSFAKRANGHVFGLVTGLALGSNVVTATAAGARAARITITNHPNGGPIFAGAQIQPWPCFAGAKNAHCDLPVRYQYWYKSTSGGNLKAYDPKSPPSDVATTTTDQGRTVPYVVREEIGAQDRGEYRIAVLDDPKAAWKPWAPQKGWNGKTYITGGSGCGMHHGQTTSPSVIDENALHRGFAVISTSLDHNTLNCNLVVQAEALMMLKERVIEAYGPIRWTIGSGCSGGSIYQQQVANAYPGIFDGILPACSYPDTWSTMIEVEDCELLGSYFADPSRWAPGVAWPESLQAAVAGHPTTSICRAWRDVYGFSETMNSRQSTHPLNTQDCAAPAGKAFDPTTNPKGLRCSLQDYMVSVLGKRPDGKANRPWDNVGVQYGLAALKAGTLTLPQFLDLNAKIGSRNIDFTQQAGRVAADTAALPTTYRGGLVDEADNLDLVPIIDLRGHDVEEIHHDYRSYVQRARLDRSNGGHANQVIWTGAIALTGDTTFGEQALTVMDQWLAGIKGDRSSLPLAQKVIRHKPPLAHDRCTDGQGHDLDTALCPALNPYYASPRIVAGSPFTEDAVKCQLKPLVQSDYSPVQFTPAQWSQLRALFPKGVCDWSRPGVGQQRTVAWQTYSAGPGGKALPPAPRSVSLG